MIVAGLGAAIACLLQVIQGALTLRLQWVWHMPLTRAVAKACPQQAEKGVQLLADDSVGLMLCACRPDLYPLGCIHKKEGSRNCSQ